MGSFVLDKSMGKKANVKIITKDYSWVMTRGYLGNKEWYDNNHQATR